MHAGARDIREAPVVKRVDDAELSHNIETEKDIESAIDTQIVGSLAPGARIVVYAAPDDERGVLDAIRTALFDKENAPSILSISFGFPEFLWTPAALTILDELFTVAALLGVSIFCASGDNGAEIDYDGKPHVLAPASSPFAHACGATESRTDSETRGVKRAAGSANASRTVLARRSNVGCRIPRQTWTGRSRYSGPGHAGLHGVL